MDEKTNYPYGEFEATKWAELFVKAFPEMDEITMLGWFSNAIMTGWDARIRAEVGGPVTNPTGQ